jgi:class 3 adenylate cyclase
MASHNKLFKQKLDFGISVNYGDIITKKEAQSLKFMGFGNFLNISKKIASLANNEVYLSDAMGKKLMPEIKAERLTIQGIDVYKIRELKEKKEEHQRFLRQFVKKLESDERKIGL